MLMRFVEELLRPILKDNKNAYTDNLVELLNTRSTASRTTVRAEREGDWPLHLQDVEKMLPYLFASMHVNYARYGLQYLRSMQRLPLVVQEKFLSGEQACHASPIWLME